MTVTPSTQNTTAPKPAFRIEKITSNYVFRRLLKALFTIWLVTTIIFVLIRLMPGNPVDILV